jgi:hypothetical protein
MTTACILGLSIFDVIIYIAQLKYLRTTVTNQNLIQEEKIEFW